MNYETQTSYTIEVTSNDGSNNYVKSFTVTVNDVNESPTNLTLSNNNVDENVSIATEIGTFTTTDPDTNNTFTYTLDTTGVPFVIDGDKLKTSGALDNIYN